MDDESKARITARAHAIWEEQGRPAGRSEEHWRQAEREVLAERDRPGGAAPDPGPRGAGKPAPGPRHVELGQPEEPAEPAPPPPGPAAADGEPPGRDPGGAPGGPGEPGPGPRPPPGSGRAGSPGVLFAAAVVGAGALALAYLGRRGRR